MRTLFFLLCLSLPVFAQEKKSQYHGYTRLDFSVDNRPCILVQPTMPLTGNPWIWRMEFFDAFPQADIALLGKGVAVAYMDVHDMYGAPVALDHMDKFYAHVTETYQLSPKPVLEGFSRGGLYAFNWAARNPTEVSCLYVDAPVCDFKSWPAGKGKGKLYPAEWEQCKKAYGLSEDTALTYETNPVDNLKPLADAKIDILGVCGGADEVVPLQENILLVEQRYHDLGGNIKVITKPGGHHHPHSLPDPTPITDFVLDHVR